MQSGLFICPFVFLIHTAENLDTLDLTDKMEYTANTTITSKQIQPKLFANFEIILLLPLNPTKLEKNFYKPTPTMKKPPALFHVLTKFLIDTSSCNETTAVTSVRLSPKVKF